jgi:hypothetical protein
MIENNDLGCFNGFKILSRKVQQTALLLSLKKPSKLDNIVERGIVKCGVWASSSFLFNSDPICKLNAGDHVGKQLIAP